MKKFAWLLMLAFVLAAGGGPARAEEQNPARVLADARAAYDHGDFNQASVLYQSLLKQGLESGELYYNGGNAEFKAGRVGRAIAFYRRALRRAPGDEDALYNLRFARTLVRQPADRRGPLERWAADAFRRFTGQTLAAAAWVVYAGFMAALAGLIITRGARMRWRWLASGLGILFLASATWASLRVLNERATTEGVIIVAQAEARNGPGENYQVGFTVPEGREVKILGREGDWVAIGLASEGYKGWIKLGEIWQDE